MNRMCMLWIVATAWAVLAVGCRAELCQQMVECCDAVAGEPGVGGSCGDLARQTRDPDTCRTILRTVRYMYEEREEEAPPACQRRAEAAGSLGDEEAELRACFVPGHLVGEQGGV